MRLPVLAVLFLSAACKQDPAQAALLSEVREALAGRDRRLTSYHVVADTTEGEATAHHEFFYRAPNHMRGTVTRPQRLTLAFDGVHFFRIDDATRKFETFEFKLPADKAAMFLASSFMPFVPEGFRTPLLPQRQVTAKKGAHPRGPEVVELLLSTKDEAGRSLSMAYLLRFPSADYLGKRSGSSQGEEQVVEEEVCDAALKLCVPKVVVDKSDGAVVATTRLSTIELNVALPNDSFTPAVPEGFTTEKHELVEEGK